MTEAILAGSEPTAGAVAQTVKVLKLIVAMLALKKRANSCYNPESRRSANVQLRFKT